MENFALEDYYDVALVFEVPEGKIEEVSGGLDYRERDERSTEISIGNMGSGEEKTISIVYTEVPPIMITSIDKVFHGCADEANVSVILIPSEREFTSYLEVEIVGPEPELKTINAQLVELRDVWPWEETVVNFIVDTSVYPDGRYLVYTRYKKNFEPILHDQTDFRVDCPERQILSVSWVGFLGIAVSVVAYLVYRHFRKKEIKEIEVLKKKLRELR